MPGHTPSALNSRANDFCKPLMWFALACCIIYAFSELAFPDVGKLAEAGLLIATIIGLALGVRNPALFTPFVLLGVSILVQTTGWAASFGAREYGFEPESSPRVDVLAKWFLFLVFALWLGRKPLGTPVLWAAAAIGFFLMPWTTGLGIQELRLALDNQRIDIGTMNAQHAAMLSGILLLGSLALFIHSSTASAGRKTLAGVASCTTLAAIALLYATQTRGVWLGVAVASASVVVLYLWLSRKNKNASASSWLVIPLMTAIIVGTVLVAVNSNLSHRIDKESGSFLLALQGKVESMPLDSTGIRLRSWYFALPFIAQKPWFGWGPDGSKLIMQESDALPPAMKSQFGHLHNTYLDITAQYGIFGLALYLALLGWLILHLIKAYKAKVLPLSTFLFGISFFIYWIIVNSFESYMLFSTGKYAFTIVCAGLISLTFSSAPIAQARYTPFFLRRKP